MTIFGGAGVDGKRLSSWVFVVEQGHEDLEGCLQGPSTSKMWGMDHSIYECGKIGLVVLLALTNLVVQGWPWLGGLEGGALGARDKAPCALLDVEAREYDGGSSWEILHKGDTRPLCQDWAAEEMMGEAKHVLGIVETACPALEAL